MTRAGKLAPSEGIRKGAMDAIRRTGNTRNQWLAAVMAVLTAAFFLRVAGQAIQRWMPQPWLPPFAEWQGSTTPYPLLVATQSVILVLMLATAIRVARGKQARRPRAARWWWWAGGIYMAASIARIVFGLLVPDAPHWFTARVSESFHLVLAAYVLAVAWHHSTAGTR